MAPAGVVIGRDSKGNFRVHPEIPDRPVILRGSEHKDYRLGQRIIYYNIKEGRQVDFANSYAPINSRNEVL